MSDTKSWSLPTARILALMTLCAYAKEAATTEDGVPADAPSGRLDISSSSDEPASMGFTPFYADRLEESRAEILDIINTMPAGAFEDDGVGLKFLCGGDVDNLEAATGYLLLCSALGHMTSVTHTPEGFRGLFRGPGFSYRFSKEKGPTLTWADVQAKQAEDAARKSADDTLKAVVNAIHDALLDKPLGRRTGFDAVVSILIAGTEAETLIWRRSRADETGLLNRSDILCCDLWLDPALVDGKRAVLRVYCTYDSFWGFGLLMMPGFITADDEAEVAPRLLTKGGDGIALSMKADPGARNNRPAQGNAELEQVWSSQLPNASGLLLAKLHDLLRGIRASSAVHGFRRFFNAAAAETQGKVRFSDLMRATAQTGRVAGDESNVVEVERAQHVHTADCGHGPEAGEGATTVPVDEDLVASEAQADESPAAVGVGIPEDVTDEEVEQMIAALRRTG